MGELVGHGRFIQLLVVDQGLIFLAEARALRPAVFLGLLLFEHLGTVLMQLLGVHWVGSVLKRVHRSLREVFPRVVL